MRMRSNEGLIKPFVYLLLFLKDNKPYFMSLYLYKPSHATKKAALALFSGLLLSSCINKRDIDRYVEEKYDKGLDVSVEEPVERDYAEIKNSGTLRMITSYGSSTYFLQQGVEWGFEYELVQEFADEHDLALDIVIIEPDENPYDLLNSGEGDLIAANYTITPERQQYVDFTRAYNLVDQIVIYSSDIDDPPQTIEEIVKREIPITVRRNSSYFAKLKELQVDYPELDIRVVSNDKDTEALLFDVASGNYHATVADDNIYKASNKYMSGLMQGPTISEQDTIAWAIRKNAPDLESQLNRFLYDHFRFGGEDSPPRRSTFLNVLRKRYFQEGRQIANYFNPEATVENAGIISPYDDMIKTVADSAGVDWLMVASMVAQETKFNPDSKSWAGAIGLMQVMPRFSEVKDHKMLYDAEVNLREGVRIIKEHLQHYAYMDSTNQWKFALAAYNAGPGHVADARRLAIDHNKDPNKWENVADALLKLMQRKYYQNARYGFCRGIETVRYVKEITSRYQTYQSIMAMSEKEEGADIPGVIGIFN